MIHDVAASAVTSVGESEYAPIAGVNVSEDLKGKVAIVTGASSGIGAAAARMLAAAGARVVVGYNSGEARAQGVVAELPGNGHRVQRIVLEDSSTMRKAAEDVRAAYGRCDILVNSAGFTKPVPHANLDALDDALFDSCADRQRARAVRDDPSVCAAAARKRRRRCHQRVVGFGLHGVGIERRLRRVEGGARQHDDGAGTRAWPADPPDVRVARRSEYGFRCRAQP